MLNHFQVIVASRYANGDYQHVLNTADPIEEVSKVGDTLFAFLMYELADDGQDMPLDRDDAISRLHNAIIDINDILSAIEAVRVK
jgi:hypothetical protein